MDINTCLATTEASRSLALYANLVPALTSVILAGFVIRKAIDRPRAYLFAGFTAVFALWLVANAILWNSNDYYLVAGFWSSMNYFELLFFLLLFIFFCLDVFPKIARWASVGSLLVAGVSLVLNVMGKSVSGFDQTWCNMNNSEFLNTYNLGVEVLILLLILGIGIYRIGKVRAKKNELIRVSIITASIVLFLGIFAGSEYVASNSAAYLVELYALFLLPIFMLVLTVAITSYGTFRLGDAVAKALFYIFLVFSGAEFFFVTSLPSLILTAIAFLMTLCFGVLLLQSYEREAQIRGELEVANEQQVILIHFITHQIKGFVTKSRNIFSMALEGDFGPLPEQMKPMIEEGFKSDTKGVNTIQEILNASNIKSGKVTYTMTPFDLKALIDEIAHDLKPTADIKGLQLNLDTGIEPLTVNGDRAQLINAFKNMIDNSIKYTPKGEVNVSLKKENRTVRFVLSDTGVGITPEDMKNLFTEGGHGKESTKVNVESTGFGLYIVKNIIDAHKGKVWAESEGAGKGSRFIVELPA